MCPFAHESSITARRRPSAPAATPWFRRECFEGTLGLLGGRAVTESNTAVSPNTVRHGPCVRLGLFAILVGGPVGQGYGCEVRGQLQMTHFTTYGVKLSSLTTSRSATLGFRTTSVMIKDSTRPHIMSPVRPPVLRPVEHPATPCGYSRN